MIGTPKTGALKASNISATISQGYTVTTADGRPAKLAIIDDQGNVVESGEAVRQELWNVCIKTQRNFWIGQGHLRVMSAPGRPVEDEAA